MQARVLLGDAMTVSAFFRLSFAIEDREEVGDGESHLGIEGTTEGPMG